MISFEFIDTEIPGFDSEFFIYTINDLLENEGFVCGDVSIVFCKDEYLLGINRQYLNHDYYTDIITFDYSIDGVISGDLFISFERVIENAFEFKVENKIELMRVIYHGFLHLCGYKDKSKENAVEMRSKEDFYISRYVSRET
jgi:probable rRNA maturation factor